MKASSSSMGSALVAFAAVPCRAVPRQKVALRFGVHALGHDRQAQALRQASDGAGLTPSVGADSLQGGIEGYWRPWGYQNCQYAEVFARAFQTLDSEVDGGT